MPAVDQIIVLLALCAATIAGCVVPAIRTRDALIAGSTMGFACLSALMLAGILMCPDGSGSIQPAMGIGR
jgi:hypothetical protein